ncbi:MAG: hypothetical protein NZ761_07300 [Dehalococcoidia bacterium]|nr:hypothetical protein [Dehalococcoidia bacterium]
MTDHYPRVVSALATLATERAQVARHDGDLCLSLGWRLVYDSLCLVFPSQRPGEQTRRDALEAAAWLLLVFCPVLEREFEHGKRIVAELWRAMGRSPYPDVRRLARRIHGMPRARAARYVLQLLEERRLADGGREQWNRSDSGRGTPILSHPAP